MNLLVVEDDPIMRRITSALLVKLGCVVTVAQNGREALEHVDAPWDLVLMDCRMPVMDGPEAVREWRAQERYRVPIVALTAAIEAGDWDTALVAGMDDVVTKPVTLDKMARVLERWGTVPGEEPVATRVPAEHVAGPGLLEDFLGFEGVLQGMLGSFLEVIPEEMEELGIAVDAGDTLLTGQLAHKIKGQLKTFHENDAGDIAGKLEFAGDHGEVSVLFGHLVALRTSLDPALERLRSIWAGLEA